jgi:predicted transcriptional regulator
MNQSGKTIKQIADEIGVTKQAIFKKIKSEPLSTGLQQFTQKVNGVVYISVDGEKLVKQAFVKKEAPTVNTNQPPTNDEKFIEHLKSEIDYLRNENSKLTEALRAEQALHAESKGMLQTSEPKLVTDGTDKLNRWERFKQLIKK